MRPTVILALAACLLTACSQTPTERQSTFGAAPSVTTAWGQDGALRPRRDGSGALTVIGTPFYALFKAVGCVGTVLIAAPAAGVIALTDRPDKREMRRQLDYGVGENCGGSYALRS